MFYKFLSFRTLQDSPIIHMSDPSSPRLKAHLSPPSASHTVAPSKVFSGEKPNPFTELKFENRELRTKVAQLVAENERLRSDLASAQTRADSFKVSCDVLNSTLQTLQTHKPSPPPPTPTSSPPHVEDPVLVQPGQSRSFTCHRCSSQVTHLAEQLLSWLTPTGQAKTFNKANGTPVKMALPSLCDPCKNQSKQQRAAAAAPS